MTVKKAKKAKNTRKKTKFVCEDCFIVFEILSEFNGREFRTVSCPGCADHISVKPYKEPKKEGDNDWTDEELELLDQYIAGGMHLYKLKLILGRSGNSINSKMYRRMKDFGMPLKRVQRYWEEEEIELLDKLINKEIGYKEVMEETGRTYVSIESKKRIRVLELGLKEKGMRLSNEEIELVDQCIKGEMTRRELAEVLDKKLSTVRSYVSRRKRKLIKQGVKL